MKRVNTILAILFLGMVTYLSVFNLPYNSFHSIEKIDGVFKDKFYEWKFIYASDNVVNIFNYYNRAEVDFLTLILNLFFWGFICVAISSYIFNRKKNKS